MVLYLLMVLLASARLGQPVALQPGPATPCGTGAGGLTRHVTIEA